MVMKIEEKQKIIKRMSNREKSHKIKFVCERRIKDTDGHKNRGKKLNLKKKGMELTKVK